MYIQVSQGPKTNVKVFKLIYILCSFAIIILKATVTVYRPWFDYCWWEFGLLSGSSLTNFSNFKNEYFISDIQNDGCKSLKPLVENYCSGFCSKVNAIENAGLTMLFLSTSSVLFEILCFAFYVWNYFKESFKFNRIWLIIVMPRVLFAVGYGIWLGMIKPAEIKSFKEHDDKKNVNFQLAAGFYIATATIGLDVITMVYALIWTAKDFSIEKRRH